MCKMLFIATEDEIDEVPFNKDKPDLYIEKVNGEFLAISDKFEHRNIYFVGSSRGCSCDIGIESINNSADNSDSGLEQRVRNEKSIFDPIRNLLGTQEQHIYKRVEKLKELIAQEKSYYDQTRKFIDIIDKNTKTNKATEMYCCWAGEYFEPADDFKTVNIDKVNLRDYFEIELKEKVKFVRD